MFISKSGSKTAKVDVTPIGWPTIYRITSNLPEISIVLYPFDPPYMLIDFLINVSLTNEMREMNFFNHTAMVER